MKDGALKMR